MMAPVSDMHKLVYLAALSVLIDSYISRKSEEKLDFLEKMAGLLTRNVTAFRQQANAKGVKRRKQADEEVEEKDIDDVSEVSRQPMTTNQPTTPTHQNQNHVSTQTEPQSHQIQDMATTTPISQTDRKLPAPICQPAISYTDDRVQEETPGMPAPVQGQDILAQAMLQGGVPMVADSSPAESTTAQETSMKLLDSMVLKLNSTV